MILTVTPNPSIDRSASIPGPLCAGAVHRLGGLGNVAAGKGVNVSRVLALAGEPTIALVPAPPGSRYLELGAALGIELAATPADGVRTNLTVVDGDGATTKLNEPGIPLAPEQRAALEARVEELAEPGSWVVLAGSLPPGLPVSWHADMALRLRERGCRAAVDTSDAPLAALAASGILPALVKPNAHELLQLLRELDPALDPALDGDSLEAAAAAGDPVPAARLAARLVEAGAGAVLLTLGGAGAILAAPEGAWFAGPPPIVPASTVAAGDSSLAGWLLAERRGLPPAERLRMAVACGSAAAALPGSGVPAPGQLDLARTHVRELDLGRRAGS